MSVNFAIDSLTKSKHFRYHSLNSLQESMMQMLQPAFTVYRDGACPLGMRDIAQYGARAGADAITPADAACSDPAAPGSGLTRDAVFVLRVLPRGTHSLRRFVRPAEFEAARGVAGLARRAARGRAVRACASYRAGQGRQHSARVEREPLRATALVPLGVAALGEFGMLLAAGRQEGLPLEMRRRRIVGRLTPADEAARCVGLPAAGV